MENFEGKVRIREIKDYFNFNVICGNEEALDRWVIVPDVNRPGLELAGFYKHTEPKRIVIIGDKEQAYIETLEEHVLRERFEFLTDAYTPCIIITRNRQCHPLLMEIAQHRNFPILQTELPTFRCMVDLISFLDEKLADTDSLHGVLVNVYGIGVLLSGESGMGKSEIALELIKKGHVLVADDRVDVFRIHNSLVGQPHELLQGMLEIRGIGVIDVGKMFGASAILDKTKIDLVIYLQKFDSKIEFDRLGIEDERFMDILGVHVPKLDLPVKEGRSMGVLVESAVTNFRLKQIGFNSAKEFEKRVLENIEKERQRNG